MPQRVNELLTRKVHDAALPDGRDGGPRALVVGVIHNGLDLLGLSARAQLMWTALVLLAAITVDRVTPRGSAT